MAEHNTMFSEGSITGILIDFVKCVREMVMMGNTVKIDNLAIFKATVEANGLEALYDAENDKVAQASIGNLAEGAKTGAAVKVIKLLAQRVALHRTVRTEALSRAVRRTAVAPIKVVEVTPVATRATTMVAVVTEATTSTRISVMGLRPQRFSIENQKIRFFLLT